MKKIVLALSLLVMSFGAVAATCPSATNCPAGFVSVTPIIGQSMLVVVPPGNLRLPYRAEVIIDAPAAGIYALTPITNASLDIQGSEITDANGVVTLGTFIGVPTLDLTIDLPAGHNVIAYTGMLHQGIPRNKNQDTGNFTLLVTKVIPAVIPCAGTSAVASSTGSLLLLDGVTVGNIPAGRPVTYSGALDVSGTCVPTLLTVG